MTPREARTGLYEQFARVAKAVAHPKRIELLDLLCQGERSVEDLAVATELGITSASAQLQVLRRARLVSTRRAGKHVFYAVADDAVADLVTALREVAHARLAEVAETVREYFEARDSMEPIGSAELAARIASGDVVVVDVRPYLEYAAGHIPGAVSIPLDELAGRLGEIPKRAEVVAYCRGPYCVLAPSAVELLREHGRKRVRRLDVGLPEWRRAGHPVEVLAPAAS